LVRAAEENGAAFFAPSRTIPSTGAFFKTARGKTRKKDGRVPFPAGECPGLLRTCLVFRLKKPENTGILLFTLLRKQDEGLFLWRKT
jgi:hypothetical protein